MKKKQTHIKSAPKLNLLLNSLKGPHLRKTNPHAFYRTLVLQIGKRNIRRFSPVPFSERIILLPQCLRKIEKCKAKEVGNRYECQECGACKIARIIQKAKKLGYKGVYILKGGSAVSMVIEQISPKAVLGVACYYEGMIGMAECENRGVPVQFVPLIKDGCVNTDLNLSDLENLISLKKPSKKLQ